MPPAASPALADRFAHLVEGLRRAIAARGAGTWLALPLMLLLWSRLRRTAERFARLAAKVHAGTLPPPRRRLRSPRPARPQPLRLPRGFAWLVRRLPQAASAASQLQHLLADPAMADLLAAAPQAGRLLRPLCQMLGVRPPPAAEPVLGPEAGRSRGPSAAGPAGGPVPPGLPSPAAAARAAPHPLPARPRHPARSGVTARRPRTAIMFLYRNIPACEGEAGVLRSSALKRRHCPPEVQPETKPLFEASCRNRRVATHAPALPDADGLPASGRGVRLSAATRNGGVA